LRIIHTSDIHLSSRKKERIEALENILARAEEKKADLLLISGDLFDSNEEADILRPQLRKMLSSLPYSIIAIPGNHDMEAYSSDMNFGDSIDVSNRLPFDILDYEKTRLTAVPYANQVFNDLVPALKKNIDPYRVNMLMVHCSLDIPYLGEDEYGDEKRQAYLPVNSKVLGDIGFDYVFAGHFHSRMVESRLSEKTVFFYSGSPVSISRKEKGRRAAVLVDTKKPVKDRITLLELDTFYYDELRTDLDPGKEQDFLVGLDKMLKGYKGHHAELEIIIGGLISSGEKEMSGKIAGVVKANSGKALTINIREEYRDISTVLEDPLYTAFRERLDESKVGEELKNDIDSMVKRQFSRIKAK
jgi:DNA repair exonuclease SbcCD nuclease subunit